MKKYTSSNPKTMSAKLRIFWSVIVSIGIVAFLAVLSIWVLWPVRQISLQTASIHPFSFAGAQTEVAKINQTEKSEGVIAGCYSKLYIHPQPTAQAVVVFHGVGACPQQFSVVAQYFYDHGYNVYVPLTPEHGRADNLNHAKVTAQQLIDYVNTSVNITDGLGSHIGVIGLSGGGNLATWAAEYRPEVKRLLALSPFYEPSVSQAPKWKIRPLMVLYGNHLVPDALNKPNDPQHALSYYALAQYVTVFHNLPEPLKKTNLQHVAVVMAADDDLIDQPLALKTLGNIASTDHLTLEHYEVPASFKLGHDIVSPDNQYVAQNQAFLDQKYLAMYEQ